MYLRYCFIGLFRGATGDSRSRCDGGRALSKCMARDRAHRFQARPRVWRVQCPVMAHTGGFNRYRRTEQRPEKPGPAAGCALTDLQGFQHAIPERHARLHRDTRRLDRLLKLVLITRAQTVQQA